MKCNIALECLFPKNIEAAFTIQKTLAAKVIERDCFTTVTTLGGMDVSNNLKDPLQMVYAVCVVLDKKSCAVLEKQSCSQKQPFPYVPGLLGFREAPALVEAYSLLNCKPDVLFIDGHGISHPRKLGIASHIGVLLDIPTIGVAKNILVGKPEKDLGNEVGDYTDLLWKGQKIAEVVRTKKGVNPLIISVGNKISQKTARELVLLSVQKYKLPEPTRQAHLYANVVRKEHSAL